MVAVPVEASLRAVMIATAKTKVARAVKSEATAMTDAIKNNGLCFTVSEFYTAVFPRLVLPVECPF